MVAPECRRPLRGVETNHGMVNVRTPDGVDEADRLLAVLSVSVGPPLANVFVGREAARSLMAEAVANHRSHLQRQFERTRGQEANSVAIRAHLQRRATEYCPGNHCPPTVLRSACDELRILFCELLASLNNRGHIERMRKPPLVASFPSLFHKHFWWEFAEGCEVPWTVMTKLQMRQRLRDWMHEKFSLDPRSKIMLPRSLKRKARNEAGWAGFQLTDEELEHVLDDTMQAYFRGRA